ncbi:MAG TPA: ferric reductase-like transmembrane domain-containing protein [Opitutaceae bacterium]|nr:ferric reductase-like transmembrane domain-containing protein [Opitutaceae bacterium]
MTLLEKLLRSKITIYVVLILMGLWPIAAYFQHNHDMLADPAKYLLLHTGFCASLLLATVLALTPLRKIWPQSKLTLALNRHRRLIGVSSFVFACLHLTLHINYEGGFATFGKDIEKPFILTGMVAFTILFILAVTSPNAAIRALGGTRWKNLHRLTYIAVGLVVYHQSAARKIFPVQVLWIFVPLALLEIGRIILPLLRTRSAAQR